MNMKSWMRTFTLVAMLLVMTIAVVSAATVEEKRQAIRNTTDETLNEVYNIQPKARTAVANAAGYAAFTITDAKLIFFGGGSGKGMAVNNSTGEEIFMGADDVQIGFGLGMKKYDVVFVFGTEKAFADFGNNG